MVGPAGSRTVGKRAVILRDTSAGSGLLMVEGRQIPFRLEGIWRSAVAPKPDMQVEAEFDGEGQLVGLRVRRSPMQRWLRRLGGRSIHDN